jgi:type I restriction enzyme M protein
MKPIVFDRFRTGARRAEVPCGALVPAKYPQPTPASSQTLVINDTWMVNLADTVQGELDRVSQTLTGRIRELAERYATPLPRLTEGVATLAAKIEGHLVQMGASWK